MCGHLDEQCSSESSCNIFNDDNRSIAIAIACSKYYCSAGCSCFCNDDCSNNSSRFKTGPKNIFGAQLRVRRLRFLMKPLRSVPGVVSIPEDLRFVSSWSSAVFLFFQWSFFTTIYSSGVTSSQDVRGHLRP